MHTDKRKDLSISASLLEAIQSFPLQREMAHCGQKFRASSLDIYGICPRCGQEVKLRSFSAVPELEDVFDAFIAWTLKSGVMEVIARRQKALKEELE